MVLLCHCSGSEARALIDTGATHSFVSEAFLRAAGVALPTGGGNPPQEVLLASGDCTNSCGVVPLRVRFKNFVDHIPCLVLQTTLGGG
jgi:hypothetical protein